MSTGRSIVDLFDEFQEAESFGLHRILSQTRYRGIPFDFERSVRVEASGVYPKRLLASLDIDDYRQAFSSDLLEPIDWMGAPSAYVQRIIAFFPKAWRIHFGWELGFQGWIGKIYLELCPRMATSCDRTQSVRFEPDQLLFLGYKWPLSDQRSGVVSKYKIHTHLPASQTLDRWREILAHGSSEHESRVADRLIDQLKSTDTLDPDLLLLEVSDEGSSRISYDINLYDLEQPIYAVRDFLIEMTQNVFSNSVQRQWADYLRSIAQQRLGHLAKGNDRNGSLFWTLYYGAVKVIPH
jgi:hypothetical protein